jgi:hypothetical protein
VAKIDVKQRYNPFDLRQMPNFMPRQRIRLGVHSGGASGMYPRQSGPSLPFRRLQGTQSA